MKGFAPARVVAMVGAGFFLIGGLWAAFAPESFYEQLAVWPPYNVHFIHDIGAFQIGLGACLVLALFSDNALLVVLGGAGVGQAVHAWAHVIDRDQGGRASDPLMMVGFAVLLLVGAALARRAPDRGLRTTTSV